MRSMTSSDVIVSGIMVFSEGASSLQPCLHQSLQFWIVRRRFRFSPDVAFLHHKTNGFQMRIRLNASIAITNIANASTVIAITSKPRIGLNAWKRPALNMSVVYVSGFRRLAY